MVYRANHSLVALLLSVLVLLILHGRLIAQDIEISIQVLNGNSGKPLPRQRVLIFGGESAEATRFQHTSFEVTTDDIGLAKVSFDFAKTKWIQAWVDFRTLCQSRPNSNSFSVESIVTTGANAPNNCGSLVQTPLPGRFVVFARPSTLREKMER